MLVAGPQSGTEIQISFIVLENMCFVTLISRIYRIQDWNASVYASFNIAKAKMPDFSKIKKSSKQLAPVHEEKLYETDRDPTNFSGCVLS